MNNVLRWAVVAVLVGHGLIHLLGVAKGFGWAERPRSSKSPSAPGAACCGCSPGSWCSRRRRSSPSERPRGGGWLPACGAAVSQVAIVTSWSDAKAGTLVNVVLVLAAGVRVRLGRDRPASTPSGGSGRPAALADVDPAPPVLTEADLAGLPAPLAAYIRRSGAVGRPRVASFYADFHGRIRSGPDSAWMSFTGKQVNTYGPRPQRHVHHGRDAGPGCRSPSSTRTTTRPPRCGHRVLSLVTVVDAAGPEMDRGETVTVFNDLVVLAPGAIIDAPVQWTALDAHHVRGDFTDGDQTVSAELTFDGRARSGRLRLRRPTARLD